MSNTELRTYRYITGQHKKTKEMSNTELRTYRFPSDAVVLFGIQSITYDVVSGKPAECDCYFLFPISAPFTILRMDYSNVFSESADEAESIDKMKTCVIPVLQYLKDNSHIQLAYQILHHMLYSVYQTALQHQMGTCMF
jgi:hypothetical protein